MADELCRLRGAKARRLNWLEIARLTRDGAAAAEAADGISAAGAFFGAAAAATGYSGNLLRRFRAVARRAEAEMAPAARIPLERIAALPFASVEAVARVWARDPERAARLLRDAVAGPMTVRQVV